MSSRVKIREWNARPSTGFATKPSAFPSNRPVTPSRIQEAGLPAHSVAAISRVPEWLNMAARSRRTIPCDRACDLMSSRCRSRPVWGSRKWTTQSKETITRSRPSGLKARELGGEVKGIVRIVIPVSTSQIRAVLS